MGRLVFCLCSLQKQETRKNYEHASKQRGHRSQNINIMKTYERGWEKPVTFISFRNETHKPFMPYQESSERHQPSPPSPLPPFAVLNRLQRRFQGGGHLSIAAAAVLIRIAAEAVVETVGMLAAADVISGGKARGGWRAPKERRMGPEEVREDGVEAVSGGFRHGCRGHEGRGQRSGGVPQEPAEARAVHLLGI